MYVVCDTNVFVHETHLLRKKGGNELVGHLAAINGRLFIPSVLEQEYVEQTRTAITDKAIALEKAISALRTLTGSQLPFERWDIELIDRCTRGRLQALKHITHSMDLQEVDCCVFSGH